MVDNIQIIRAESPDSIEMGTPGKGGAIKVYGDGNNKEAFRLKIDNLIELRSYMAGKVGQ